MPLRRVSAIVFAIFVMSVLLAPAAGAQQPPIPTGDQLDQLVAPIALYPDTLLAQICAASTDPQQILDADNWLKQNKSLQGQALINAAQAQKFDPAFVSLVGFPSVLDMMAAHIDDYAALGAAFKANQQTVMDSIQQLRQAAYASGALDTNEYQKVSTETQGNTQVIVVQPANPQVVYVPQYNPQVVYSQQQQAPPPVQASGPSTGDVVAASLLSFGVGIAIGALIANNNQPYGWGGWGWGWGRGGMYYHNSVFIVNNRYVCPHPYYRPRPVPYNRPIYARPPANWNARPYYRPPPSGYRPYGPNSPGYRPGARPPAPTPYRPAAGYRPPAPVYGANRPATGNVGATRPTTGNVGATRPATPATRPATPATRPATPATRPATPSTGNVGAARPATPATRPAPSTTTRPSGNQWAGHQQGGSRPETQQTQRPQQQQNSGGRQGAFGGSNSSGAAERQASNRGKQSFGGGGQAGGRKK